MNYKKLGNTDLKVSTICFQDEVLSVLLLSIPLPPLLELSKSKSTLLVGS